MAKKQKDIKDTTIALNRRARFDFEIVEELVAGVALEGWEVKSLRDKKVQITQGHVIIKRNEAWLIGSQITPLLSASSHVKADPLRNRKLLLHKREIRKLLGAKERQGYTIIALKLFWSKQFVKVLIALAKGKKNVDKRHDLKTKDWNRQKQRLQKMTKRQ